MGWRGRSRIEGPAFVAREASVIGKVRLAAGSSVWYQAVLRGDPGEIEVGEYANIQDGCVLHADPGMPIRIGEYVSIGHGAILHGATVGARTLVGMGAILLDGCEVGSDCIIAAGTLIPERAVIPTGSLVMGVPGFVRRQITQNERTQIMQNALDYAARAVRQTREERGLVLDEVRQWLKERRQVR